MRRLSPLLTPLSLVALCLALFGAWMHWAVLDPRHVGWLLAGDDRGASAAGLAAYLRAGQWPALHEPLLGAPEGAGLLFTDSIPLLGLVLGPAARWLPTGLQFIGLWLLVCVALQVVVAWLLVRPHAPDRLTALLATALLAAMPALFNRYGHASLCAQWVVLWALWIYTGRKRSERAGWWTTAIGAAALIHTYLLLMTACFWAATILRLAVARRWRAAGVVTAPPLMVAIAILGWHGAFAGGYESTASYGAFPFALDAWWNPANPSYSALLPSSPEDHGRGFEGLNYLGAGLLALVAIAVVGRMTTRPARRDAPSLAWLVPGFLVLTIVAIGPQMMWRGHPVLTLTLSDRMIDALDPVRAAGRLMWAVTYTIAYAAIVAVMRRPRATLVLGAACALQVVDLTPMLAAVRATSARADDPRVYRRTLDPRWVALIGSAKDIEFEPPNPFIDLQLMEELTWRAVAACRPVRSFYFARDRATVRSRLDDDSEAFAAGQIDPARLYVLLDGRVPPALTGRVERIDGVMVVTPVATAPAAACVSRPSAPAPSSPRSVS